MGCDTCIHLNNVLSLPEGNSTGRGAKEQKGNLLEPCSMRYNCNPYFKEGHDESVIITESFCATCQALDKECQCEASLRAIRTRKRQVPRNR
jgi:hypothetical protein